VPLFNTATPRSDEPLLRVCSWCKKVDTRWGWCEAEEAVVRLGLFEAQALPDITHGICQDCYERVAASYS
jgi:hypothetical protein